MQPKVSGWKPDLDNSLAGRIQRAEVEPLFADIGQADNSDRK